MQEKNQIHKRPETGETIFTPTYNILTESYFQELQKRETSKLEKSDSPTLLDKLFFFFTRKFDDPNASRRGSRENEKFMDLLFFDSPNLMKKNMRERLVGQVQALLMETNKYHPKNERVIVINFTNVKLGMGYLNNEIVFCVGFHFLIPMKLIRHQMYEILEGIIMFYGPEIRTLKPDDGRKLVANIGSQFVPFVRSLHQRVLSLFNPIVSFPLPYKQNSIFLKANQFLDSFYGNKRVGYLSGAILYNDQVLCYTLSEEILQWCIYKSKILGTYRKSMVNYKEWLKNLEKREEVEGEEEEEDGEMDEMEKKIEVERKLKFETVDEKIEYLDFFIKHLAPTNDQLSNFIVHYLLEEKSASLDSSKGNNGDKWVKIQKSKPSAKIYFRNSYHDLLPPHIQMNCDNITFDYSFMFVSSDDLKDMRSEILSNQYPFSNVQNFENLEENKDQEVDDKEDSEKEEDEKLYKIPQLEKLLNDFKFPKCLLKRQIGGEFVFCVTIRIDSLVLVRIFEIRKLLSSYLDFLETKKKDIKVKEEVEEDKKENVKENEEEVKKKKEKKEELEKMKEYVYENEENLITIKKMTDLKIRIEKMLEESVETDFKFLQQNELKVKSNVLGGGNLKKRDDENQGPHPINLIGKDIKNIDNVNEKTNMNDENNIIHPHHNIHHARTKSLGGGSMPRAANNPFERRDYSLVYDSVSKSLEGDFADEEDKSFLPKFCLIHDQFQNYGVNKVVLKNEKEIVYSKKVFDHEVFYFKKRKQNEEDDFTKVEESVKKKVRNEFKLNLL